jgi:hypothetical protein
MGAMSFRQMGRGRVDRGEVCPEQIQKKAIPNWKENFWLVKGSDLTSILIFLTIHIAGSTLLVGIHFLAGKK